jgi:hypothetical protein
MYFKTKNEKTYNILHKETQSISPVSPYFEFYSTCNSFHLVLLMLNSITHVPHSTWYCWYRILLHMYLIPHGTVDVLPHSTWYCWCLTSFHMVLLMSIPHDVSPAAATEPAHLSWSGSKKSTCRLHVLTPGGQPNGTVAWSSITPISPRSGFSVGVRTCSILLSVSLLCIESSIQLSILQNIYYKLQ